MPDVQPRVTLPPEAGMEERVATRADYPKLGNVIKKLRYPTDPNPAMVEPFQASNERYSAESRNLDAISNTARYLQEHPDAEPVKCFRIWIGEATIGENAETPISAQFHMLPLHDGRYVEVTPPEHGDAGKRFMIVPTTRAYQEHDARALIRMHHTLQLRLRLGAVYHPQEWALLNERLLGAGRAGTDADKLVLYACPFAFDLPQYMDRDVVRRRAIIADESSRVLFEIGDLLQLMDAKRWPSGDKSFVGVQ